MKDIDKWPVLRSLDRKTMEGVVRELGTQFKEHDPLAQHTDEKTLYARLGARSVVNWLDTQFLQPKPPKKESEENYPQW